MKKVTAFIGNQQKHATFEAVCEFGNNLKAYGDIEFEYVFLKDYRLEYCRGCKICFNKGEEYCPLKDDRDVLMEKMIHSDGIIFATPNYAFHVSAPIKNLLDRLAFVFHRPRFFGKTFTAIVNQGIFGGSKIVKYLSNMGENFGFQVTKGCVLTTLEPRTEVAQKKMTREIKKASERFYKDLMSPKTPVPSFLRLMLFRMSRTSIKTMLDDHSKDYRYYKEQGWFESGYYYPVSLGPIKRTAGLIFDFIGKRMAKNS
ncbi:flavodoxin family protein [Paenibacillus odorifer]|uniref:flavodoxin family protein n=1 Tax=Paenibacillus odorifer TaxID=189426 RepID=UPI0020BED281|nr:flavodoxin family protein [Paenibacillus odorifer]